MKHRHLLFAAALAVSALAAAATFRAEAGPGHDHGHDDAKPAAAAAAAPAAKAAPAAAMGDAKTARWTATTYEAATAEANKKVLESGKVATVTGEIVDVSCWMQLGKRGEGHIACGSKCIANGEPIGLLDAEERLYILFAEEHHPRRDGQVSLRKTLAPYLAKQVTLTGMATELRGYRALFLQAAELDSMAKAQPAK